VINLDLLLKLAAKATKGARAVYPASKRAVWTDVQSEDGFCAKIDRLTDAEFVAAMTPEVVTELITRLRIAERAELEWRERALSENKS
jgi:hypothetical protein